MSRFVRILGLFGAMMWAATVAAQTIDPAETSLRLLRRTITAQRDGSHQSLLFALRQLRDPALQPLLLHLLASPHWQMQVHGALGLGEVDANKTLQPCFIIELAPHAQDAVIATALDLELLPTEQFADLLDSDRLQPMARLVLMAELVALGQPVNADHLRALSGAQEEIVAALASALLLQLGENGSWAAFASRMQSMPEQRRIDLHLWLFEAVRRYKLTGCLKWIKMVLEPAEVDSDVAYRGIYTLLELDTPTGLTLWAKHLGPQPSYAQRVRYTLALLASGAKIPASAYERINVDADEELLAKLVAVGRAISTAADITTPLIALLDLHNVRATTWAMQYIATLPSEQAATIYVHLLDRIDSERASNEAVSLAVQAVPKLFRLNPELVLRRLQSAPDDGVLQQAMLLGLFDADSTKIGEAVQSLRRIGSGRADSLALLLLARHATALSREDVDQLGTIASGGARLSDVLQVQAAWLYLKHTGQIENAMKQLFRE